MSFASITLRNLLSFGPETPPLRLGRLNVLIGANGSGKSNLLEAIGLLRSTPVDLRSAIVRGGGASEWLWKGDPRGTAYVEVVLEGLARHRVRHAFSFRPTAQGFSIEDERVENEAALKGQSKPFFYYRFQQGQPMISVANGKSRRLAKETIDSDRSVLAQRRDPETFPEITRLAEIYSRLRVYNEWTFGRDSVLRQPQKTDLRTDRLEEDFSNLGLFLNRLRRQPGAKAEVLSRLRDVYEGISDFDVLIEGGTVQVFLTEGAYTIPATRLSDGTVRYLCLLAILCDPAPPPLICIEEPELGLHPDLLPKVADLLTAAATRTQLVVTTHSDVLVDALTDQPESVVVFEKHRGVTTADRLDKAALGAWLQEYRLGELWTRGDLGGNRW